MVAILPSSRESAPKTSGPDFHRDLSADGASDFLHANFLTAELDSEIARLSQLEPTGFEEVPITAKLGRRGKAVLHATYFRSNNPSSEVPVGIYAGLGASDDVYLRLAMETANLGRDAYIMRPQNEQDPLAFWTLKHLADPLLLQMQAAHTLRKALNTNEAILEVRDGLAVMEVDEGYHSMANNFGPRSVTYDRFQTPDVPVKVRSMISIAGAGLDGKEGVEQALNHGKALPKIVRGVARAVPEMLQIAPRSITRGELRHWSHLERRIRETGYIILKPQVGNHIIELRGIGIPYAAMLPDDDDFFPDEAVLEHSGDIIDLAHVMEGGHMAPNADPHFATHLVGIANVINHEEIIAA